MKCQAVELLQLCDRTDEEAVRILDDITAAIHHFCALHRGLTMDADDASDGLRTLLLRKAIRTESIMVDVWHVAGQHLPNLCSMPVF